MLVVGLMVLGYNRGWVTGYCTTEIRARVAII